MTKQGVFKDARLAHYLKINNVIHHINRLKNKNHLMASIDAENVFDKNSISICVKNSQKICNRGEAPQKLLKNNYKTKTKTKNFYSKNYLMMKD